MAYLFTLPGRVVLGENALQASAEIVKSLGNKAFIVTGKNVTKAGLMDILLHYLNQWGIDYEIYSEIIGEPTDKMIETGVARFQQTECDFLIAIGGGSPLDSGKAIAVMSVLPGKISDYMGVEICGDFPPVVLIPTTAGTGSEATKFSIITNKEKAVKMLLKGEAMLPKLAIIDPSFTMTVPPSVTAATGMDALTHAVEAYTSRKGNTLTDMYALSAISRIFQYLPKAYRDGNDEKAREEMSIAAFEAGVCINNASVTLVHGMSRPIGALFSVPHGISNAVLIYECLAYVLEGCYDRFAAIARVIGAANTADSDEKAAKAFLEQLRWLCSDCNIPTLKEYGIVKTDFDAVVDKMAQDAMDSSSPSNTIKVIEKKDLLIIYGRLWK